MELLNTASLALGLIGNVISFMVFLSPLPTLFNLYKRKSTEGVQSFPYVVGLSSLMLWLYYELLKGNAMLITVNSVRCFLQTFYLCFHLFYTTKMARIKSLCLIGLSLAVVGLVVGFTQHFANGNNRDKKVGWICLILTPLVFFEPLTVMRRVINTRCVDHMARWLSLARIFNSITWFFYLLLLYDFKITFMQTPNVLEFTFGVLEVILSFVYKEKKRTRLEIENISTEEQKLLERKDQEIIDVVKLSELMCSIPVVAKANENNNTV